MIVQIGTLQYVLRADRMVKEVDDSKKRVHHLGVSVATAVDPGESNTAPQSNYEKH